ncbi:MAG: EAL domain-containing protein [Amphritea sp.]|nr:EAL domain-containing protein [Amphritea sp.]
MTGRPAASVTGRLHHLFLTSTAVVLMVAGVVVLALELMSSRDTMISKAESFTGLTAPHLANALATESPLLANLLLENYFSEADLLGIYVYRLDGSDLVHMIRPGTEETLPTPDMRLKNSIKADYRFSHKLFEYSQPIRLKQELIGQIYLQYSLSTVVNQLMFYLLFGLVLYLVSLLSVYHLSRRIQRGISQPIDQLLRAMHTVIGSQKYEVRVPVPKQDSDVSDLIRGFNQMLEQIGKNTQQLAAQQKAIEQHVFFDPLTGLANRRMLLQRMEREVIRSRRSGHIGGLLYMDLDHFKTINDSLGHAIGDAILMGVAKRISAAVREVDTPARLGGDEFVVLLPELGKHDSKASNNALSVAEKVRQAISEPHLINDRVLHVTPSIGIALFDQENSNFETLIMQADLAMYRAKDEGRNRVQFFLEHMQEHADHRQQIEERLRAAIDQDLLHLCYQPQVNAKGEIFGAEALVRWKDSDLGVLNPDAFIPIAEMTDLICCLGRWVLSTVCSQIARWNEDGRYLTVSINISPREFQQKGFVESVEEIVLTTGISADQLVFELTEGVLLSDIDATIAKMKRLNRLGVSFSLDDFGTGYSSLRYLKQLPLDALKIDQSFVCDITKDANGAAIVATIIAMSRHLKIDVVAEGVEQQDQLDYLIRCGCSMFQGFLFFRPMPPEELEELIPKRHKSHLDGTLITTVPTWDGFDSY